jgi:protein phosphatase 2C family protein 2/3
MDIFTLFSDSPLKGNVGDSRAIASVNGTVVALSEDHKPNNENEVKRIVAAGGWVQLNRVNGNLALSRALGDFIFKRNDSKKAEEQIVTGAYTFIIFAHTIKWSCLILLP